MKLLLLALICVAKKQYEQSELAGLTQNDYEELPSSFSSRQGLSRLKELA